MTSPTRLVFPAAMLALVGAATLLPASNPDTGTFHWCLFCGSFGLADFIRNVILFVPPGLALRAAGLPARRTIAGLAALSLAIEIAQLWIPGRDSALGDFVSNTTGAAVAVLLWWWFPRRRPSVRNALAAGLAFLAAVAATGVLLKPVYPRTIYYGQWTPDLGMFETYRGKVLSADIGGLPLHSWRLDNSEAVRQQLEAGAPLRVRFTAGPAPSRMAPVFNIMDHQRRLILLLGADREDLVLRVTTRATDARLEEPGFRWRGALAGVRPGDTLAITVWRPGDGYCLTLGGRPRCGLRFGAADGWKLLVYWPHLPAAAEETLDALWLVVLATPALAAVLLLLARHTPTRKSGLRGELP